MHTIFRLENLKGRDHTEDLDKAERIILKWILKKCICRMDSSGLG